MSRFTPWHPQRRRRDAGRRRLAWGLGVAVLHGAVLAGLWWGDRSTWVSVATGVCCTAGPGAGEERVSVLWLRPDGAAPEAAPVPVRAPVLPSVATPVPTQPSMPASAQAGAQLAVADRPVRRSMGQAGKAAAPDPTQSAGVVAATATAPVGAAHAVNMGTLTATAASTTTTATTTTAATTAATHPATAAAATAASPGLASGAQGAASAAPGAMAVLRPAPPPVTPPAQPAATGAPVATVAARMLPGNPLPVYPEAAREDGLQGTVYLEVQLDAGGRVLDVHWRQRSGVLLLDQAARDAVRHWRFEPARRAGEAVPAALRVAIHFRLAEPVAVGPWAEARWP